MTDLPTPYQDFIHRSRYARWLEDEQRRETWGETVERYMGYMTAHLLKEYNYTPSNHLIEEVLGHIKYLEIMPSMRAMMTAGEALDRDHIAGFNCSYIVVDHPRAFDEILYILMCGTGVGFSCERQFISKLPEIPEQFYNAENTITVRDSKLGWAKAFKQLIAMLYAGEVPRFDTSNVRPAGARLKTFGGRASGPEPLIDLFLFTIKTFERASGRKLESQEVHDLICKIADVVVCGGVRRSALISLSNLSDQRMRDAKSGQWWDQFPYRALANNSVAYTEKPETGHFMQEWLSLYQSRSGERGIFNRAAAIAQCEKIGRKAHVGNRPIDFGTNPCGEIILRPMGFCNLTEVIARADDTYESLENKVRMATILGTWQSTLTNYRYIRSKWKENAEEERLLGVSITGIMDCPLLNKNDASTRVRLERLRSVARETNKLVARDIGINPSAAITCIKPSGTVSQLVDAASGIHSRHASFYLRRVRHLKDDPLSKWMVEQGFPHEIDRFKPENIVFTFPMRAPEGQCKGELTAIGQLEMWLLYREAWCDHNPSITVTVREHEWPKVGAWVYDHFDQLSGVSFLPYDGGSYVQAPYEAVSEETLVKFEELMPDADFSGFKEEDDDTIGSQELACSGGACAIP